MMPDLAAMPEAAARRALIGLFESADPNGQRDRMLARLAVRLAAET